jgi:hypothetical protein
MNIFSQEIKILKYIIVGIVLTAFNFCGFNNENNECNDSFENYSVSPIKPIFDFEIINEEIQDSNTIYTFNIDLVNKEDFHDSLFVESPELCPCGLNTNASRTWIRGYVKDNGWVSSHCGINNLENIKSILILLKDNVLPKCIYFKMIDRKEKLVYESDIICLDKN